MMTLTYDMSRPGCMQTLYTIFIRTVEAPVRTHPWEAEEVSLTRTVHL